MRRITLPKAEKHREADRDQGLTDSLTQPCGRRLLENGLELQSVSRSLPIETRSLARDCRASRPSSDPVSIADGGPASDCRSDEWWRWLNSLAWRRPARGTIPNTCLSVTNRQPPGHEAGPSASGRDAQQPPVRLPQPLPVDASRYIDAKMKTSLAGFSTCGCGHSEGCSDKPLAVAGTGGEQSQVTEFPVPTEAGLVLVRLFLIHAIRSPLPVLGFEPRSCRLTTNRNRVRYGHLQLPGTTGA